MPSPLGLSVNGNATVRREGAAMLRPYMGKEETRHRKLFVGFEDFDVMVVEEVASGVVEGGDG